MTADDANAIVDHYRLLNVLVGAAGGGLSVAIGFVIYTAKIMNAIDKRVAEKILLSLDNGAGARVREIAYTASIKALQDHSLQCPLRDRVEFLEDLRG